MNFFSHITETFNPDEDSSSDSEFSDRYAHIYTPGWDGRFAIFMSIASEDVDQ